MMMSRGLSIFLYSKMDYCTKLSRLTSFFWIYSRAAILAFVSSTVSSLVLNELFHQFKRYNSTASPILSNNYLKIDYSGYILSPILTDLRVTVHCFLILSYFSLSRNTGSNSIAESACLASIWYSFLSFTNSMP